MVPNYGGLNMNLSLLQDIQCSDVNAWTQFQYYWERNNYSEALNVLNYNPQLVTKYVGAEWLNALTALVYQLEIWGLERNQIKVSYLPPPNLKVGEVWFQLELNDLVVDVNVYTIPTGGTSVVGSYTNTLIDAVAFKDEAVITINQLINETGHTVTFSTGEPQTEPITCIIYSIDSTDIVVNTTTATSGTSLQASYSGSLLSVMLLDNSNNRQLTNTTITSSTVNYSLREALTSTVKGRIVSIPTNKLADILNTSNQSFSSTSATLVCDGYLVSCFVTDSSNNVIQTDIGFELNTAIIGASQNSGATLNCVLYYT